MQKKTGKFLSHDERAKLQELYNAGKSKSKADEKDPERLKRWEKFQIELDKAAVKKGLPLPTGKDIDGDPRHYGLNLVTGEIFDLEPLPS